MKEPRIMQMDWKALGYQSNWKDGYLVWVKDENEQDCDLPNL